MKLHKLLPALLFVSSTCPAFGAGQTEWVIDDIITPPATPHRHIATWHTAQSLVDLTHTGRAGYALLGADIYYPPSSSVYPTMDNVSLSSGVGGVSLDYTFPEWDPFSIASGAWSRIAVLRSANGPVFVARDNMDVNRLYFFSMASNRFLGVASQPPPNPGDPPAYGWKALWNAGDINSDGTDDLFFQTTDATGANGYLGLVDGQTHLVVWRILVDSAPGLNHTMTPTPTIGFPDLNGDSIPDFVASLGWSASLQGPFEKVILALSGNDGATIFETRIAGGSTGSGITSLDITGDGVADIVTQVGSNLVCIDGQSGLVRWQTSVQDLAPFIPGGIGLSFQNPVFFGTVSPDSLPEYVHTLAWQQEHGESALTQYVGTFRCSDGVAIGAYRMRESLAPFLPDNYQGANFPFSSLLGDIDRDGLTEFAHFAPTPSQEKPPIPGTPNSVIIYGQPTLDFPPILSLSQAQSHVADFSIPSAAGMFIKLYLSSTFDHDNGFTHDNWPTFLGEDRLFVGSARTNLLGLLDANGECSISFGLPNHPALLGEKIYARGVVGDPSDPLNKVWTISSLGIGSVVP